MKVLTLLFFLIAITAQAQTWSGEIQGSNIVIHDGGSQANWSGSHYFQWEYIFWGDCKKASSGKISPSAMSVISIPAGFEEGFLIQKVIWLGWNKPTGGINWSSQTSTCYALVLPDCTATVSDTVYLQPLNLNVSNTQSPDWYYWQGGQFEPTPKNPGNVSVTTTVFLNGAGYIVTPPLQPGLYFAILVEEWQGMTFIENETFLVP